MSDLSGLISLERYYRFDPETQGYVSYMQAAMEGSELPDKNPYMPGSKAYRLWNLGNFNGMLEAQDSEE